MKHFLVAFLCSVFALSACASESKPVKPQFDCTQKKNANRIQCKEAPKSDVEKKAVVKKPTKVRKADKKTQEKAKANLEKK